MKLAGPVFLHALDTLYYEPCFLVVFFSSPIVEQFSVLRSRPKVLEFITQCESLVSVLYSHAVSCTTTVRYSTVSSYSRDKKLLLETIDQSVPFSVAVFMPSPPVVCWRHYVLQLFVSVSVRAYMLLCFSAMY